jgi:hypothetical protein
MWGTQGFVGTGNVFTSTSKIICDLRSEAAEEEMFPLAKWCLQAWKTPR